MVWLSYLESIKKDYAYLEKKAHDRLIEDNMSEDEIVIQRVLTVDMEVKVTKCEYLLSVVK